MGFPLFLSFTWQISRMNPPQASLNVRDTEGRSPLMWAVWEGKLQIVTQLLEVGGATQVTDGTGRLLFQVTGVDVGTKDGEGRTLEQVAR